MPRSYGSGPRRARRTTAGDPSWTTDSGRPTGFPALADVEGLERIAVIGAGAEANTGAVARLAEIVPGARVAGMPGEEWNGELEEAAVDWLARLRPQLVLLGLGMPLQEQVLARRLACCRPRSTAPSAGPSNSLPASRNWRRAGSGRLGLEWAWRLLLHPQRVAYRVFGEPWVLLGLLLRRRLYRNR